MFLIEYDKGLFVNATQINWLSFNSVGKVQFTMIGDIKSLFTVPPEFAQTFLNNLQAIDGNR